MDRTTWITEQFEAHRAHLRAVAVRMLGSSAEADDAVQESWIRLSRSDTSDVQNLGGWLTTVVSRVCLDMLRSRASRREATRPDPAEAADVFDRLPAEGDDPEADALLADSIGPALLVVLSSLSPAERLAFVLHDMFAVPFEDIGTILRRSPSAAKQLASRARRRVQGGSESTDDAVADRERQRAVVDAFLAASRQGDFEALLTLLAPDVVLRADDASVAMGAAAELVGASAVAGNFSGRALAAQPAMVEGSVGIAWAPGGVAKVVWDVTIVDGRIVAIEMLAGADTLEALDLALLEG